MTEIKRKRHHPGLQVVMEENPVPPYEHCCLCDEPTAYWYQPKDVPCCPRCAKTAIARDIPTKMMWARQAYQ